MFIIYTFIFVHSESVKQKKKTCRVCESEHNITASEQQLRLHPRVGSINLQDLRANIDNRSHNKVEERNVSAREDSLERPEGIVLVMFAIFDIGA